MFAVLSLLISTLSARTAPLRSRLASDRGIEAVEYALIAALIAAVLVGAVALLNPQLDGIFQSIANLLGDAAAEVDNAAP